MKVNRSYASLMYLELEKLNLEQFKKTEQNTEQAAQNVEEKRDQ